MQQTTTRRGPTSAEQITHLCHYQSEDSRLTHRQSGDICDLEESDNNDKNGLSLAPLTSVLSPGAQQTGGVRGAPRR